MKEKFSSEEKFVVDYIRHEKEEGHNIFGAFTFLATSQMKNEKGQTMSKDEFDAVEVYKWLIGGNQEKFALAFIGDNYEIEEELYRVQLPFYDGDHNQLNLRLSNTTHNYWWGALEDESVNGALYKSKFTLAEIEAIDPRYKQFAELVGSDNNAR